MTTPLRVSVLFLCVSTSALAQPFVNWESPTVHPMEMTPDGLHLLVVNLPDNRLEVFDVSPAGRLTWSGSIPVGLDPVTVRARSDNEIWVVNHISDSISIVRLSARNVVDTLRTKDEPTDIVFAGAANRAFVTCSQVNLVQVFDPLNLTTPPIEIPIDGEDPRALCVSPDGNTVYAAIFESGNASTLLNAGHGIDMLRVVNFPSTPYGGVNPPPNGPGGTFVPPQTPGNPPPPGVGLIIKKNSFGQWVDDNGADWSAFVTGADPGDGSPWAAFSNRLPGWDLPDRDIAIIDANTTAITNYAHGFMNIVMSIATNPVTGAVSVIGTDATNEVRYEPNLTGTFVRDILGLFDPNNPPATQSLSDLNPHLDYSVGTLSQPERDRALGDPRAIVWSKDGSRAFIAGLGSNNVVIVDDLGNRVPIPGSLTDTIAVGRGPAGLVLDETRGLLYVHNRFDATVSVVSLSSLQEEMVASYFDPSPDVINRGRKLLYDTHFTSGLGQASCASCHVDARMDRLAWDLGAPDGTFEVGGILDQNLGANTPTLGFDFVAGQPAIEFQDWHPMKGPMTTTTLQDIIGQEPFHWRGDKFGIEEFSAAYVGLLGDDAEPTPTDMQDFEDFLDTISYPPNPFRNLDNTLPTSLALDGHFTTGRFGPAGQPLPNGNAVNGLNIYRTIGCVACHTLPTGMGTPMEWDGTQFQPFPVGPMGEQHRMLISRDGQSNRTIKVSQLRNMYEKSGTNFTLLDNNAGFGYMHDGSIDSIEHFVGLPVFNVQSDQDIADLTAFMLAFSGSDLPQGSVTNLNEPPGGTSQDTHAAVGFQSTVTDGATLSTAQVNVLVGMLNLAQVQEVGVVAKGLVGGLQRGYTFRPSSDGMALNGLFQSDRALESITPSNLLLPVTPGSEITLTIVPFGSEDRIGIDRDLDGFFDRDELDAGSDPADPLSIPVQLCNGDANHDGMVDFADITSALGNWLNDYTPVTGPGDADGSGIVNFADITSTLGNWLSVCP